MKLDGLPTEEVWICEDLGLNGGIAQSAIALSVTERIRVGHGIAPAAIRNVAYYAMESGLVVPDVPALFCQVSGTESPDVGEPRDVDAHCLPTAT
jgi:hypothetical protein